MAAVPERYAAFLSYDRRDDALCDVLHRALESLGRPFFSFRARRVFRYTANLPADGSLPGVLNEALASSDYFVLLATPNSAVNKWVGFEIQRWLHAHEGRPTRLLLALGDGAKIAWDDVNGDFDWDRTNAIHPVLKGLFQSEPRYVDLRQDQSRIKSRTMRDPVFRDRVAEIAAPLAGCNKEALVGRYVILRRRILRAGLLLLVALAAITWRVTAEIGARRAQATAALAEGRVQRQALLKQVGLPPDLDDLQPQLRRLSIHKPRLTTAQWLTAPLESFEAGEPFEATGDVLRLLPRTLSSLRFVYAPPFVPLDFERPPFSDTLTDLGVELRPGEGRDCCAGIQVFSQQRVTRLTIRFPEGPVALRRLPALPRLRELTIEGDSIDLDGIEQLAEVTHLSLTGRIMNAEKLTILQRLVHLEIDGSVDRLTSAITAESIIINASVRFGDSLSDLLRHFTARKAVGMVLYWEPLDIDLHDVDIDVAVKLPGRVDESKRASRAAAEFLARHRHVEQLAVAIDTDQLQNLTDFPNLRVLRLHDIRMFDKEDSPMIAESLPSLRVLAGARQVETLQVDLPVASFDGLELFDRLTDLHLGAPEEKLVLPMMPRLRRLVIPKLPRAAASRVPALEELILGEPADLDWREFSSLKSLGLARWGSTLGPAPPALRALTFGTPARGRCAWCAAR